jgi:hypothetical protein
MIDVQMLETADKGFIVTGEKLNAGVVAYLNANPDTRIKQLSYNNFKYDKIEEGVSIWE